MRDLRSKEDNAPEVAYSEPPIALPTEAEGLQFHDVKSNVNQSVGNMDYKPPIGAPHEQDQPKHSHWRKRIWLAIACAACVVIAIAVGLGVHYGSAHHSSQPEVSPEATSTMTTTTTSIATATSSAVTSGTTGIADFSCESTVGNDQYTTKSNPTTFTEECLVDYPNGGPANDSTSTNPKKVTDLRSSTVYSFQDCMEECSKYNQQEGELLCHAVTYRANLTVNIERHGANCWLKDARGEPVRATDQEDYKLQASAFITGS